MPSLENLKKQAKQYLRWHRDRYYPVAAQIRAVVPRFRHMNDPQILGHRFKLSDAQELVARQSGYGSWQALKKGLASMPEQTDPTTAKPVLISTEAQLFVSDIKVSCNFFVAKLGFAIEFTYGEPPFYAQVRRDEARVNLRHVDGPVFVDGIRSRETLLSASINVDDVKQLYLEYQAAGIAFHQKLRTEPWGARTFIIEDPDGNLVLFA
jgi:catechol 2,3-dioxygenase-like lactoylglutathione lyase family enzyme